jgi:hypothetical protein
LDESFAAAKLGVVQVKHIRPMQDPRIGKLFINYLSPQEGNMKLIGLLVTIFGWLLAVSGVIITGSLAGRYIFAIVGIGLCLVGILGLINSAHVKEAVWKR